MPTPQPEPTPQEPGWRHLRASGLPALQDGPSASPGQGSAWHWPIVPTARRRSAREPRRRLPHRHLDVGILDDPKVRQLVRLTRDEAVVARCLIAYVSTVASSWDRGERVSLEDSAPLWLTALDDLGDRLAVVGLLDEERRIPERAG